MKHCLFAQHCAEFFTVSFNPHIIQVVILKEEQREKKREKEKRNDTGRPSLMSKDRNFIF